MPAEISPPCVRAAPAGPRTGIVADFPYRFDADQADRFFRFAGKLRRRKGNGARNVGVRTTVIVRSRGSNSGWSLFGWVHVETGLRRFRTAYNEVPRKNGKTLEAAIVALYVTFYDNEPGAEGYCLATKRGQAMFVFNDCKKLIKSSGLKSRIKIMMRNLHREDTASKLEPLGANPEDGLNPNLIVVDEYHKIKARDTVDVWRRRPAPAGSR